MFDLTPIPQQVAAIESAELRVFVAYSRACDLEVAAIEREELRERRTQIQDEMRGASCETTEASLATELRAVCEAIADLDAFLLFDE